MKNETAEKTLEFIRKSPSCFHAVGNIKEILKENGFSELSEGERWKIEEGGRYFVTRNSSSILSFVAPGRDFCGFRIAASHSDSPSFKIKENPEMKGNGCVRLNVEKYGGMLMQPWFDRPLSIAGRAIVRKGPGAFDVEEKLVSLKKNLVMIPNLAIHFARDANDGRKINVQSEMMPVIAAGESFSLKKFISEQCGIGEEDILGHDLFLSCSDDGVFWGADDEFIASPRLDDLECAYTTLLGFIGACKKSGGRNALVHAVFDNEEVGSGTRQGADSTFLEDTLRRINGALGRTDEDYNTAVANSFLVSADNAHAVHPAYPDKSDPINRPRINGGIVIKHNAAQKYTTDALSSSIFRRICADAGIPTQTFTNNSNVAGGSTLGNISTAHVSALSVDIGLAQWAMHSPFESAGSDDAAHMARATELFYAQ